MAFESLSSPNEAVPRDPDAGPWYRGLTGYHWFVFIVASLGWLFDTMDQQLFNLAREPAMKALLGPGVSSSDLKLYGGYATSTFMVGWAIGGLIFGILGDRIGRAKTMLLTILLYSGFTGLSAISQGIWDFAFYRFLTGLGVGGEFAVGVALVAEVMPDRARPYALGLLQALSAVGNMLAAVISIGLGLLERKGVVAAGAGWRVLFLIGVVPALLTIPIFLKLKEPDRWRKASAAGAGARNELGHKLGSLAEFFGDPRWRNNAIAGMLLAFAGVVGLWGIGFFSPELISPVLNAEFSGKGLSQADAAGRVTAWKGVAFLLQNLGAFFGINAYGVLAQRMGRRPAFAIALVAAMLATAFTFRYLNSFSDIFWMIPLMGFCQLSLFGGYAIYFPELFPTRLRSTGTSFCYNVGRLVAAAGPLTLGLLTSRVYSGAAEPFRWAGVTMCGVFLIGLLALPFAPETKGKPLPE